MDVNNFFIEDILSRHKNALGEHFQKYRNHVYRVFHYTTLLNKWEDEDKTKLAIAAAFHDIGLWTNNTLDYLSPSIVLANAYLEEKNLLDFSNDVEQIIDNHHKLTHYKKNLLAENFRQADLMDLTSCILNFGVPHEQIRDIKKQFPSLGFKRFIFGQILLNFVKHPLTPLPIVKL